MIDFIMTLVSMAIGALITWLFSWWYYRKAGRELTAHIAELRTTSDRILRWLEVDGEQIAVVRDETGRIVGLVRETNHVDQVGISAMPISGELKTHK